MNIAMEQTEEYVDGQLKSKYGDCFIRGNNGMCTCYIFVILIFYYAFKMNEIDQKYGTIKDQQ